MVKPPGRKRGLQDGNMAKEADSATQTDGLRTFPTREESCIPTLGKSCKTKTRVLSNCGPPQNKGHTLGKAPKGDLSQTRYFGPQHLNYGERLHRRGPLLSAAQTRGVHQNLCRKSLEGLAPKEGSRELRSPTL
ncbi:hypothetical protein GWK47_042435 [Chionoecetes opilio]|uniref:Uncharacterized protein n=1 Tax=Chionoecetes opilio TaxID=41210 RepID=A0A8J4YAB5_CHIOP|nr:hypothetical protein GWK47_042435 [Chionoecetes opilio]